MRNRIVYIIGLLWVSSWAIAEERPYLCEIGLQGGLGYYAGEAAPHIFQNVSYAAGAHFRYKFDSHWALKLNGTYQLIQGPYQDYRNPDNADLERYLRNRKMTKDMKWQSPMVNVDVTAEFNFFRLGIPQYDGRVKPYSPYIFLGVGCGIIPGPKGNYKNAVAYIPVGVGFKWQFVRWGALHVAWQHNICLSDDVENVWDMNRNLLGNTHNLNGSNIMNTDITSQLTVGIVFAFAQEREVCRMCEQENKR